MQSGEQVVWRKLIPGSSLRTMILVRVLEVRPARVRIEVEGRRGKAKLWVPAADVYSTEVRGLSAGVEIVNDAEKMPAGEA